MFSKWVLLHIGAIIAGAAVFAIFANRRVMLLPMQSTNTLILRAQGCLFGQYIGDALGTRYEFRSQSHVEHQISLDRDRRGFLPILGGGPFHLKPGQVTDDTELAMALARSLLDRKKYDFTAVSCAYKRWFDSGPFDVGMTTENALNLLSVSAPDDVSQAMLNQAQERNSGSLSNGCLMRISPLAIAGTNWPTKDLVRFAKLDAQLTNPHVDAQIAVACYTAAVSELIRSGDEKAAFQTAQTIAKESPLIMNLLNAAEQKRIQVQLANGDDAKYDTKHMGYLAIAFQWAFTEMLYASSFEEGLVRVISRGGDTDTNGCICGAMLGARFGVDAISKEWKRVVSSCKQRRMDAYPWVDSSDLDVVGSKLLDTLPSDRSHDDHNEPSTKKDVKGSL